MTHAHSCCRAGGRRGLTLLGACLALAFTCSAARAEDKDIFDYAAQRKAPAGTRKIAFVATKGTHGARGNHEFRTGAFYLARKINEVYPEAYAVVYSDDPWPNNLVDQDAIIVLLNHGGRAAEDAAIRDATERGAGFMAVHFGVEVNKGDQGNNYLKWMGGYFECFYSVNPHWKPEITVNDKHPAGRGVKPFSVQDEWYYHMRFRDKMEGVTPILSAVAPLSSIHSKDKPSERGGNPDVLKAVEAGEPQHLAWAYERPDGGRGFGFTGYHTYANLANDSFRTTLLNGVAWIAKLDIPDGGVPSKTLTPEQLEALLNEAHPEK